MSRKVCLLQAREVEALTKFKRRPNCYCHGHITRQEADEALRCHDLKYIGLGRTYAMIVPNGKLGWKTVTQKFMGEKLGFTTLQLTG
ncbi:MAG TPA: hypothetical protein VG759_20480 [Candidatus Angelobacter sp.]|jgi:hypothetical protein|nr:hypothetical protein [Candidatus Angelobacter sp.]